MNTTGLIYAALAAALLPFAPHIWRRMTSRTSTLDAEDHYTANREITSTSAAYSIAASWIWGPAIFVSAQLAFSGGVQALFWFLVPNILTFFTLIPIASRVRESYSGYTLPGFLSERSGGSRNVRNLFIIQTLAFQLCAVVENNIAIKMLLSASEAMDAAKINWVILFIDSACVGFVVLCGFRGAVRSEVSQMLVTIVCCVGLAVMLLVFKPAQVQFVNGLSGTSGASWNPFQWAAMGMGGGVAMALGLIGGPMGDMMFFQRLCSVRKGDPVKRALKLGAVLFAVVPICMAVPGWLAASVADLHSLAPDTIAVTSVLAILPWKSLGLFLLALIVFNGLITTLDASFSSISAVAGADIHSEQGAKPTRSSIRKSWLMAAVFAAVGVGVMASEISLLPVFLTDAAIASSMIVPMCHAVFSKRPSPMGLTLSLAVGIVISLAMGISGAVTGNAALSSFGAPAAFLGGSIILGLTLIKRRATLVM
ncbi:hypothetical protein [Prosthecobacter sp.]|uniref:hypothetical protein n=1 Tax=Prosthecobacter sp. TaxID=1965333 RepID=UPI0037850B41